MIPIACRSAQARTRAMLEGQLAAVAAGEAREDLPMTTMAEPMPTALPGCEVVGIARACSIPQATQTVFGEGPAPAPLMLVGEQPGDQEDLAGRPFVGPAGMPARTAPCATPASTGGRSTSPMPSSTSSSSSAARRPHQKPNTIEINACRSWLRREIALVPQTVVALGATAARALSGRDLRIGAAGAGT
ncbi:MAG: uracil-DNA glycosylase family protein [Rhodospirillales bacterium]